MEESDNIYFEKDCLKSKYTRQFILFFFSMLTGIKDT